MMQLVLIKIGGGLITDKTKPFTVREDMLDAASAAVAKAFNENTETHFIVATGGGSFGHYLSSQKAEHESEERLRISAIHESVLKLNIMFAERLIKLGVPVLTLSPSSIIACVQGAVQHVSLDALRGQLANGHVPLLHGDIYADGTKDGLILSTESLFEILVGEMRNEYQDIAVIYTGEVQGVLDPRGVVIAEISSTSWTEHAHSIGETPGYDVTGGMKHKVESALRVAAFAQNVRIVSGKDVQNITAALAGGSIGTKIVS